MSRARSEVVVAGGSPLEHQIRTPFPFATLLRFSDHGSSPNPRHNLDSPTLCWAGTSLLPNSDMNVVLSNQLASLLTEDSKLPYLSRLLPKPGEVRPWAARNSSLGIFLPPTEDSLRFGTYNLEPYYQMPLLDLKRPLSPLTPLYQNPFRYGTDHATPRRPEPIPVLHRPCAACRNAKVKCDRASRCSRCVKLGIVCKMPPSPQQRRPRDASSSSTTATVSEDEQPMQKRSRLSENDMFKPLTATKGNELDAVDLNVLSPVSDCLPLDGVSPVA